MEIRVKMGDIVPTKGSIIHYHRAQYKVKKVELVWENAVNYEHVLTVEELITCLGREVVTDSAGNYRFVFKSPIVTEKIWVDKNSAKVIDKMRANYEPHGKIYGYAKKHMI